MIIFEGYFSYISTFLFLYINRVGQAKMKWRHYLLLFTPYHVVLNQYEISFFATQGNYLINSCLGGFAKITTNMTHISAVGKKLYYW